MLFLLVKIRSAQILVRLLPRQHPIDIDEDDVPDRNQVTLFSHGAPQCAYTVQPSRGVLRLCCDMSNFDQHLPQPATPSPRLATQALPPLALICGGFVVAV